jgi:uncharacterized NAD(P)/FAD-binding protein YdhS
MRFRFAIIGGGLTATSMLSQLIKRVQKNIQKCQLNPTGIHILIFEKQDQFGPGFPHNASMTLPFHITNMCAADMGILVDKPNDFQDWVTVNLSNLQDRMSWFRDISSETAGVAEACHHYPRAIVGEYLKTRFQEAVQSGRDLGLVVELHPRSEVVDLTQTAGVINLRIKDRQSQTVFSEEVDRVLLATGHWPEKDDQGHYFSSPWPASKLRRRIPPGEKVAIIGTSLSAIETLLTLTSEEKFKRTKDGKLIYEPPFNSRKFTLYSRNGLLPKVRGKLGNYQNMFLNRYNLDRLLAEKNGNLTLNDVFGLLNKDLENAYGQRIDWHDIAKPAGKPVDLLQRYLADAIKGDGPQGELIWQTVLYQSFDMARDVYLNLTLDERKRFDTDYTSLFFTHAATQPSINAEKLLALMKAGIVDVVKLDRNYRITGDEHSNRYEIVYVDGQGIEKKDCYQYVVDARGQQRSYETNPSSLAQNLIKSGTIQFEEFRPVVGSTESGRHIPPDSSTNRLVYRTGSIWIDPETHRIMQMRSDRTIIKSKSIYAVGAMTRGQIIDASMARGIVLSTARIADDLVEFLIQSAEK